MSTFDETGKLEDFVVNPGWTLKEYVDHLTAAIQQDKEANAARLLDFLEVTKMQQKVIENLQSAVMQLQEVVFEIREKTNDNIG